MPPEGLKTAKKNAGRQHGASLQRRRIDDRSWNEDPEGAQPPCSDRGRVVAGVGLEPTTCWLWASRATAALSRNHSGSTVTAAAIFVTTYYESDAKIASLQDCRNTKTDFFYFSFFFLKIKVYIYPYICFSVSKTEKNKKINTSAMSAWPPRRSTMPMSRRTPNHAT